MSWHDVKHAVTAIIFDAIETGRGAPFLRYRADLVASGADNITWDDAAAMVRAVAIGAKVLGL